MCSFKSIYFVIFILNLYKTHAEISDKRLCVDQECNEPVSLAKTLLRYSSPDPRILSFAPNTEITIYSKEAGSETNLWGAVIKGKRGYVPKHLVREYKVYKKPTLLVDTELNQKPQVPEDGSKKNIDPDNVKQPYEIVDGTTIYLNPQDSITPSSTENPVLSTSLPPINNVDNQSAPGNSKEKDISKETNIQKSVLESVSSSFSKWINDDTDSKEVEAEDEDDDDEEGDEDEDDDEEESSEDDLQKTENKLPEEIQNVAQDVNSLHNLPPGIKISPYSLELEQPLDSTNDVNKEDKEQKPLQESSNSEPISAPTNNGESLEATNESTEKQSAETVKSEKIEETKSSESEKNEEFNKETQGTIDIKSGDIESTVVNVPEDTKPIEYEKNEELNREANIKSESSAESVTEPSIGIESVTEPSAGVEEEQLPFLDVTTPDPLEIKEQGDTKTEQVIDVPSSQDIQENKNIEVDSSVTNENVSELPEATASVTLDSHSDTEIQKLTADEGENSPDNTQNDLGGDKQTENKEEISDETVKNIDSNYNQNDFNDVSTENTEEQQNNVANEVPDHEEKIGNTIEDQNLDSTSTENVDTSKEIVEPVVGNKEEIFIDNEMNDQEQIEEINNDVKEELQSSETENIVETSPEEPVEMPPEEKHEIPPEESNQLSEEGGGIWSGLFSFFGGSDSTNIETKEEENGCASQYSENPFISEDHCDASSESCNVSKQEAVLSKSGFFDNIELKFNSDFFLLLITTAGSVIIFLFVYMALDRHKREAPLVARVNKLEKELLITLKENELLQEKGTSAVQEVESVPNEVVEQLTQRLAEAQLTQQALQEKVTDLEVQLEDKAALEDQIEGLEKELETSTEVGMELNRIISEMLDPTNGSDRLRENVEQLQRQLLEQKDTINNISETLQEKEAENRLLRNELERSKKVAGDLQSKVDEMVEKILKIEREKDQQQNSLQSEISMYQQKYNEAVRKEDVLNNDIQIIRVQLTEVQRQADIKTKEYQTLKESLNKMKSLKNDSEAFKSLLDATSIKAEIQQLKAENATYAAQLQQEQAVKVGFEKKYQAIMEEIRSLKEKYEQADKEKVEANSRLEVLNNYFKKRESELQEEIIKYKSIWDAKEGEATSTTERIKYMQEEIENYKAHNETLKQEIVSQEIDLKSQISMLEKKVHENWVTARQTERKLEDARQEAAQLRNRLTLRERVINEERIQNRLQSPVEQNGELPLSPHTIDSPASPPLLYGARDHITKSPPLPGLPPFLPPPPGAPFMPPPLHGMPPFMPPPPSMFPGDHRPPPLGRMSSPPLNSRYSPDTSAFSPYDRHSPSPPYDSEYGASPPPMRGYNPYNNRDDRRDYKRPPHGRSNGRNGKGSVMSSGSDHSNDSLDKINRKQSKMV
ncbi:transport and Golgi organization protein 1 [Anoplophora glabripennis]|uniref:transport and Golgi organization protein 1 n=1 Tax=Anoplophora glabripennis TaxID=217634 RepID=UPI000874D1D0|nr:transport and Golgi organization protein 1 [Anoplophora glabripennis]